MKTSIFQNIESETAPFLSKPNALWNLLCLCPTQKRNKKPMGISKSLQSPGRTYWR